MLGLIWNYLLSIKKKKRLAYYRARPILYREWLTRYGKNASKSMKAFIRCYAGEYGIPLGIIHKLGPDDSLDDFDGKHDWFDMGDGLEFAEFATELERNHVYQFADGDGDLSLGQLFEKVTGIRPAREF